MKWVIFAFNKILYRELFNQMIGLGSIESDVCVRALYRLSCNTQINARYS